MDSSSHRTRSEILAAIVPQALIAGAAYPPIARILDAIAPGATRYLILECPLSGSRRSADLSLHFSRGLSSVAALAALKPPKSATRARGALRGVRTRSFAVLRTWATSGPTDGRDHRWFEFDTSSVGPTQSIPCVFFAPAHPAVDDGGRPMGWRGSVLPTLQALLPSAPRPLWRVVDRALREVHAPLFPFQVGAMLSRPAAPVRLQIEGGTTADVFAYLKRVGWVGDWATLTELISNLGRSVARITFGLNLTPGGLGREIGIECLPPDRLGYAAFVPRLRDLGLVTALRAPTLATFAGRDRILGVQWHVHHVKATISLDGAVRCKAYLGVLFDN